MSIFLWIVLPLCWLLTGKLAGLTLAATCFFSESGKRTGRTISSWSGRLLPVLYLLALLAGGSGNAGYGFKLFGSEALFDLACGVPLWSIPILGLYVGALYVVRDLTLGHTASSQELKS